MNRLSDAVSNNYHHNWLADGLPAALAAVSIVRATLVWPYSVGSDLGAHGV